MNFTDALSGQQIDPHLVLMLRHRPTEPSLKRVLPWLVLEREDLFNAYQSFQGEKLEKVMRNLQFKRGYVASFIANRPGQALFTGLYRVRNSKVVNHQQFWEIQENKELAKLGMHGFSGKSRSTVLWFNLERTAFYPDWKGRLIIKWPPPERSWWRWAHRNIMPIHAILEENALQADMPEWDEMIFTWAQLKVLPVKWQSALSQWRGVYYIYDTRDGKGYVGSAYGEKNILGRWLSYASKGDGGNRLLRGRDPETFRFTILQRVSPDMHPQDVIHIENTWKQRLHTRSHGLNDN